MWKALAALVVSLFSLSVSAASVQVIDDFESGTIGSQWSVINGAYPADVDVYNAISAFYDGGEGPKLYYPPEGSWMVVIESGDPATTIKTSFTVSNGATLKFSWFFHTPVSPYYEPYVDDSAGVVINGTEMTLITSGTTGGGVGMENTGWQEFSVFLPSGQTDFGFWVKNDAAAATYDSQFAVDNIRVTYAQAVPEPSTYALMLSGLGLVGFAGYRRRT